MCRLLKKSESGIENETFGRAPAVDRTVGGGTNLGGGINEVFVWDSDDILATGLCIGFVGGSGNGVMTDGRVWVAIDVIGVGTVRETILVLERANSYVEAKQFTKFVSFSFANKVWPKVANNLCTTWCTKKAIDGLSRRNATSTSMWNQRSGIIILGSSSTTSENSRESWYCVKILW